LTLADAYDGFIAAGRLSPFANPSGTIFLALGYGAAVIGVANLERGKAWLGWAAPLGRMAFTNYLAQSLIFCWIFYGYGYGLGLFGRLRRSRYAAPLPSQPTFGSPDGRHPRTSRSYPSTRRRSKHRDPPSSRRSPNP